MTETIEPMPFVTCVGGGAGGGEEVGLGRI